MSQLSKSRNTFCIIAGGGYPAYQDVIRDAIADANSNKLIDRVVVVVDSEDMSLAEKQQEMAVLLAGYPCRVNVALVIQHFCIEAWALGNRRIGPRNPREPTLRQYKNIHDVLVADPELLPPLPSQDLNRAQFALLYLRCLLNDRSRRLSYSKRNPKALLPESFFREIESRLRDTGHVASFASLLSAFG